MTSLFHRRLVVLPLVPLVAFLSMSCAGRDAQVDSHVATPSPVSVESSRPDPTPIPPPDPFVPSPALLQNEDKPLEVLPLTPAELEPAFPGIEFDRMVLLTHAGDESGRLFLVLQPGQVVVFENDPRVELAQTFLDVRNLVSDAGNEEGLLGLAFDPAYTENGYFYVYYSAANREDRQSHAFRSALAIPTRRIPLRNWSFLRWNSRTATTTGATSHSAPTACFTLGLGTVEPLATRRATGRTCPPS